MDYEYTTKINGLDMSIMNGAKTIEVKYTVDGSTWKSTMGVGRNGCIMTDEEIPGDADDIVINGYRKDTVKCFSAKVVGLKKQKDHSIERVILFGNSTTPAVLLIRGQALIPDQQNKPVYSVYRNKVDLENFTADSKESPDHRIAEPTDGLHLMRSADAIRMITNATWVHEYVKDKSWSAVTMPTASGEAWKLKIVVGETVTPLAEFPLPGKNHRRQIVIMSNAGGGFRVAVINLDDNDKVVSIPVLARPSIVKDLQRTHSQRTLDDIEDDYVRVRNIRVANERKLEVSSDELENAEKDEATKYASGLMYWLNGRPDANKRTELARTWLGLKDTKNTLQASARASGQEYIGKLDEKTTGKTVGLENNLKNLDQIEQNGGVKQMKGSGYNNVQAKWNATGMTNDEYNSFVIQAKNPKWIGKPGAVGFTGDHFASNKSKDKFLVNNPEKGAINHLLVSAQNIASDDPDKINRDPHKPVSYEGGTIDSKADTRFVKADNGSGEYVKFIAGPKKGEYIRANASEAIKAKKFLAMDANGNPITFNYETKVNMNGSQHMSRVFTNDDKRNISASRNGAPGLGADRFRGRNGERGIA